MHNIKVKLISHSSVDGVLSAIGKPYKNENPSIELVKKICCDENYEEKHGSVLEHVYMTFDILGASRCFLQEMARHRIASPTVESTRFSLKKILKHFDEIIKSGDDDENACRNAIEKYFLFPENDILVNKGLSTEQITMYYNNLYDIDKKSIDTMRELMSNGISQNDILKYFIVENFRINMTWTINLRSYRNFLKLRKSEYAHFEINSVACQTEDEVNKTWIKELI
ncbi:FAD-dependent thymidylate synthase [uncultured Arcobacter sp.]|uniref:FAD-dependent thymidylate synthase n=1 Tax=uncultured Arcobacter sp. TaxID=165434 RepID=UPI00261AB608|nr:FAD-dependent thymidylate synthase [uncultured Arcobacter sp.]